MIVLSEKQKNIFSISMAALIGLVVFLLIYSELFNPTYDAWLLTGGPDLVQHYVGWLMYRQSSWSFPVGLASAYAYPFGTPITYTDSIPLLAIIFKLLRSFLPLAWQYTGLWIMLCFVLQGCFAYLLLKTFIHGRLFSLFGSIFFVLSPTMLFRLGGHFALGGHWLILWGLWLLLRNHQRPAYYSWGALLILSVLVHPYLLFMNIFLLIVDIAGLLFIQKSIHFDKAILFLLGQGALVLSVAYILGIFSVGQATANGYGDFSMNLNALINPLGWSRLVPDLPIVRYQAEGFNYLGLGIIILLLLSIYKFLADRQLKYFWKNQWPLIVMSVILVLVSVSNVVAVNSRIIMTVPWPDNILENVFGFFRSSGRFFWPVYYLLFVGAFYIIKDLKFRLALCLIIGALFLQIYDLSFKINNRGHEFENKTRINTGVLNGLEGDVSNYRHMIFLPVIPHRNFPDFAVYAAEHNLTINDGYFARPVRDLDQYRDQIIVKIKSGDLDKDTIYVFSREADVLMANIDLSKHLVKKIDTTVVLFPYFEK